MLGDPCASLPVLNFVLLKYSRHVAAHILSVGVEVGHCMQSVAALFIVLAINGVATAFTKSKQPHADLLPSLSPPTLSPPTHTKSQQLQAKTDDGFVRGAFRLCRDHLGIRTVLTPAQFLEQVRCGAG